MPHLAGRASRRALIFATALLCAGATADAARADTPFSAFRPAGVGTADVSGFAEAMDVSPDGKTLVYGNSDTINALSFEDISDPQHPRDVARIETDGNETSAKITKDGKYVVYLAAHAPGVDGGDYIGVADMTTRKEIRRISGVGNDPDAIAISPDGAFAAIAVEDEFGPDQGTPNTTNGKVQVLSLTGAPSTWALRDLDALPATSPAYDLDQPSGADLQPEYAAVNAAGKIAVSIQEQNAVAIYDAASGHLDHLYSAGRVVRPVDPATGEPAIDSPRQPDAIAWAADGRYLLLANEGEFDGMGGRGISVLDTTTGAIVWDSGLELNHAAAQRQLLNVDEAKSSKSGEQWEGVDVGSYGGHQYAFAVSERGGALAAYSFDDPVHPQLLDVLGTGARPETVVAFPGGRNLVVASGEAGAGTVSFFSGAATRAQNPRHPQFVTTLADNVVGMRGFSARGEHAFWTVGDRPTSRLNELPDGSDPDLRSRVFAVDFDAADGMTAATAYPLDVGSGIAAVANDPVPGHKGFWTVSGSPVTLQRYAVEGATATAAGDPVSLGSFSGSVAGAAITPDGTTAYVLSARSPARVYVVDLVGGTATTRYDLPNNPDANSTVGGIALTPSGDLMLGYAGQSSTFSAVRFDDPRGLQTNTTLTAGKVVGRDIRPQDNKSNGTIGLGGIAVTPTGHLWAYRTTSSAVDPGILDLGVIARAAPGASPRPPRLPSGTGVMTPRTPGGLLTAATVAGDQIYAAQDAGGIRTPYFGGVSIAVGAAAPTDLKHLELGPAGLFQDGGVPDGNGGSYTYGLAFTGGSPVWTVHHLRADGSYDPVFAPMFNGQASALALTADGLAVAGYFTQVNGQPRNRLVLLDPTTGATVPGFDDTLAATPTALAAEGHALFVAGGGAVTHGATTTPITKGLARLDTATGAVTELAAAPSLDTVNQLVATGGKLYAGGRFALGGGAYGVVRVLDPATGAPAAGFTPPSADATVQSLAVDGSTVYLNGGFTTVGGEPRASLAAISATTGAVQPFHAPDGSYNTFAIGGGAIYAYEPSTTLLRRFDATTGAAAQDWTLRILEPGQLLFSGGRLLVMGSTTTTLMQDHGPLLRLDAVTRAIDDTFDPQLPKGAVVTSMVFNGSRIIAGLKVPLSTNTGIGGAGTRPRIVAIDPGTGAVTPFGPDLDRLGATDGAINALALSDGRLYVGGSFDRVDGEEHSGVVALDPQDGHLLSGFSADADAAVIALAFDGGRLYVGGRFTRISGVARFHLAALDPATGAPLPFDAVLSGGTRVANLAASAGIVAVSSDDTTADSVPSSVVATFDGKTGALRNALPAGQTYRPPALTILDGELLVSDDTGNLAFDLATGAPSTRFHTPTSEGSGSPVLLPIPGDALLSSGYDENGQNGFRLLVYTSHVSGTPTVGRLLTCTPSSDATSFAWTRDGVAAGGSDATHRTSNADAGAIVACTATLTGGATESEGGIRIATPPVAKTLPALDGTLRPGIAATCGAPVLRTGETTDIRYGWLRDGVPVANATGASYVPAAEDAAHELSCQAVVRTIGGSTVLTSPESTVKGAPVVAENHAPMVATAGATPSSGAAPLTVAFTAAATDSDGDELTYTWDLDGNGTFESSGQTPSFIYTTPGTYLAVVKATDPAGASDSKTVTVTVSPAADGGATVVPVTVGGTVPGVLALTFGAAPSLGTFVPGVDRDYTASVAATVTSSAMTAALTVRDPSATATGHLVNGVSVMPQALQARAGTAAFAPLSSTGSALPLTSWATPVGARAVAVEFKQPVAATDSLLVGTYGKTLTFTLSTTAP